MGSGERPTTEYKATVVHDDAWPDAWRVLIQRWVPIPDGWRHTEIERRFWLRWSAVRFANSERRILKAFRKHDRQQAKVEVGFERAAVSGEGEQDA